MLYEAESAIILHNIIFYLFFLFSKYTKIYIQNIFKTSILKIIEYIFIFLNQQYYGINKNCKRKKNLCFKAKQNKEMNFTYIEKLNIM